MKVLKVIGIVALIAIILAIFIPFFINPVNNDDKYAKMQSKIDSLMAVNDSIQKEVIRLDLVADTLLNQRKEAKERIIYIKTKAHENIRTINGYNGTQLDSFFSSKYIIPDSAYTRQ